MATPVSAALRDSLMVLIVDDEIDTLDMYHCYLSLCGLMVERAVDGPEAIVKTKLVLPDVVVTDITLPGVDGFEVCRQIRRDPVTASIPLIAVTGYSRPNGPEEARRAGFDAFLLKPTSPPDLLFEIHRVVRRSRRIDRALNYR